MSSAASVSYSLEELEGQRRARERRRLDELARQLRVRREDLVARIDVSHASHGVVVEPPQLVSPDSDGTDLEQYSRRLEQARQQIRGTERELEGRISAARTQALVSRIAGSGAASDERALSAEDDLKARRAARPNGEGEASESGAGRGEDLAKIVTRVVGRLDAKVAEDVVKRIEHSVAAVLDESDPTTARRTLDLLRREVQEANETVAREEDTRAELDDMRRSLAEVPGPKTAEMMQALDAVARSGAAASEPLRAEVDRVVTTTRKEAERRYVLAALRNSLATLGYEVGDDFETLLAEGRFADARRPAWRGYAVRVRSVSDAESLHFTVVRGEASDSRRETRDREVEESWCSDLPELLGQLVTDGITPEMTEQVSPGSGPVLAVPDLPIIADGPSGEVKDKPRERQADGS